MTSVTWKRVLVAAIRLAILGLIALGVAVSSRAGFPLLVDVLIDFFALLLGILVVTLPSPWPRQKPDSS